MRVPPPLVWGRALSVATVFFVWFFFCVSSQYLVRCAVYSAAPSRPGGTRTCAYARRARARAEMRDVSGRDRDGASRSSLRSQLGGTVIMCAVRPRRICVSSTPARLGLGTCHCERYISSSGLRPVGTSDDVTTQSVTASHGIHVTNRTRMSRSTPPITNGVVFSTPARLGLGTCHCERYISSSGLRPVGTSDDATMQPVTASHGIHVTNRTNMSRSTPPITNGVVFSTPARLGLGTYHCERYISSSGLRPVGTSDDATMQSVTASHGIHVTNRTRISRPTLPISNDVVTSDTGAGLAGPPQDPHLAKAIAASGHHTGRGWASKPPPLLPSRTVLCREAKRPRTPGAVGLSDPPKDPPSGPGSTGRPSPAGSPPPLAHTTRSHRPNPGLRPPGRPPPWLRPLPPPSASATHKHGQHTPNPGFGHPGKPRRTTLRVIAE